MSNEALYICWRRVKAGCLGLLFLIMRICPIKRNKIAFAAFEGDGGFGCNPRYIAEELHRRNNGLEMVWLTHHSPKVFPHYIKVVKDSKLNTAFHLSTACVWVDNYRKPYGTMKRRGQLYLQTWHAMIGFKAVGLFRGKAFPKIARLVSEWDSNLVDYVLSNSDYCDKIYPQKLLYSGDTLRTGSPRCDCIINDRKEIRINIRKQYNLQECIRLVLFAPTFRGGDKDGKKQVRSQYTSIDFNKLLSALSAKTGGEWRVMLRLHPQLAARYKSMPLREASEELIDVSQADDMSELIAACDLLITDYSSCAFDAAFAKLPVLLYADDIEEYKENRGSFMWEREELPFLIAENNEELEDNVKRFDYEGYCKKIDIFMNEYNVLEDGMASERVADIIEEWIGTRCKPVNR